jgi:hypothetical protein
LSVRYAAWRTILPSVAAAVHRPAVDHLNEKKQHYQIRAVSKDICTLPVFPKTYFLKDSFKKSAIQIKPVVTIAISQTEQTKLRISLFVTYFSISVNFSETNKQMAEKPKHLAAVLEDYL